jgi:hypothetical protein
MLAQKNQLFFDILSHQQGPASVLGDDPFLPPVSQMNQFSKNEVHATLTAMNKMSSASRESAAYGPSFNQKLSNYLSLPNSSTLQQFDQLNQFPPSAPGDSFQNYNQTLGPDVQLGLHSLSGNTGAASMDMNTNQSLSGVDGGYLGSRANNSLGFGLPSLSMGNAMGNASNRMLQGNNDHRGQDNNFSEPQQLLFDIH